MKTKHNKNNPNKKLSVAEYIALVMTINGKEL
jgi:hypothetical protein